MKPLFRIGITSLLIGAILSAPVCAEEEKREEALLSSHPLRMMSPLEMREVPLQELFPEWRDQAAPIKEAADRFFERARLSEGFIASNGVQVPRGIFRSYLPDERNQDNQFLAAKPRFWSYDVALAVYYLLKTGRADEARTVVDGLVSIARQERAKGFKGLWRFSYAPHYCDPRAPMGAVTWVFQALYAYILQTGDTRHLGWLNQQLYEMLLDENSPLQRNDPSDPLYGLIKAGYTGVGQEVAEHFILEHQHNACRVLRLSYWATQRYAPGRRGFLKRLVRRHDLLMTKIRELFYEDDEAGTARFFTSLDAEGRPNPSEAWDNSGWMAWDAYDEELNWKTLNRLIDRFTVTLPASSFEGITPGRIAPGERVHGLFFFTSSFRDPYVEANPRFQQMLQPEATFGVIIRLVHFAGRTQDPQRRRWAVERANELWHGGRDEQGEYGGMLRLLQLYDSENLPGYSYATLRVQDFFNSLRGIAANGTAGVLAAAFVNGVSISDYLDVPAPPEMTVHVADLPARPAVARETSGTLSGLAVAKVRPQGIEVRLPEQLRGKWAGFYIQTDQLYYQGPLQQVTGRVMDFPVKQYVEGWDNFPGAVKAKRRVLAFFDTREAAQAASAATNVEFIGSASLMVEYSWTGAPKLLQGELPALPEKPPVIPLQEAGAAPEPVVFSGFTFQTAGGESGTAFEDDAAFRWVSLGLLEPGKERLVVPMSVAGDAAADEARRIFTQFDLSGDRLPPGVAPERVVPFSSVSIKEIQTGDVLLVGDQLDESSAWALVPPGVKPVILRFSPEAVKTGRGPQIAAAIAQAKRSGRPLRVLTFDIWRGTRIALLDSAA